MIVTGWATTVGVIGWSLGGGHGPLAPGYGLGVDNILEATIVLANATVLTVNANQNADLFWALRGGGGSNWGILTSITIKSYPIPTGGLTFWTATWAGNYCNNSQQLNTLVDAYSAWTLQQTSKIGGFAFFTPSYTGN